jgi:hypothetical protein
MRDEPSPAAGDVAGPSMAVGDDHGDPAPWRREELEAQIAMARDQMAEVKAAISSSAIDIDRRLGYPSQRLEELQYALQAMYPASASLPFDTAAEEKRAPVVIHSAQKNKSAPDPSRVFNSMMKDAAKPARISFPKFIAQQMRARQCSVEALDPEVVTNDPTFGDQHADVQKLVNEFLILPPANRRIPDVLSRIDSATKEIERELALATPAPLLLRKPRKKKPDRAALIKAFDDSLANNGPSGLTRVRFVLFVFQLLGRKNCTAANLNWKSVDEVRGLKNQDFRVQAAVESFLKLTPDERFSHDVARAIEDKIGRAGAAWMRPAEREKLKAELLAEISKDQIDAQEKMPSQAEDSDSTDSEFENAEFIVSGLAKIKKSMQQQAAEESKRRG